MSPKYFYVITRDGQVFEMKYDPNLLMTIAKTMTNKGLITLKDYGLILNGVDISKVMNEDQYQNYVKTVNPKQYIRNGTWYDSKENSVIRHEKWKQAELDKVKFIETKKEEVEDPEKRRRISEMCRNNLEKFKKLQ